MLDHVLDLVLILCLIHDLLSNSLVMLTSNLVVSYDLVTMVIRRSYVITILEDFIK